MTFGAVIVVGVQEEHGFPVESLQYLNCMAHSKLNKLTLNTDLHFGYY